MKRYQYAINERVMVWDDSYWIIPATVTAIDGELYKVEYDCGGYDWLLHDEIRPLEYHKGDYVQTMTGIGKVIDVDGDHSMVIVSYGKLHSLESYYEFEIKPAQKPSLWARLLRKDVYLYA
jgi:hypothetical protein